MVVGNHEASLGSLVGLFAAPCSRSRQMLIALLVAHKLASGGFEMRKEIGGAVGLACGFGVDATNCRGAMCCQAESPSSPRTRRCEWGLLALVPELGNLRDAEMCEGAADV